MTKKERQKAKQEATREDAARTAAQDARQTIKITKEAQAAILEARKQVEQSIRMAQMQFSHSVKCIAIGAGVPDGPFELLEDASGFTVGKGTQNEPQ